MPPPVDPAVTLLIVAAACLVLAQVLGLYALKTRKADVIFSLCMVALLVGAIVLGGLGAYDELN